MARQDLREEGKDVTGSSRRDQGDRGESGRVTEGQLGFRGQREGWGGQESGIRGQLGSVYVDRHALRERWRVKGEREKGE